MVHCLFVYRREMLVCKILKMLMIKIWKLGTLHSLLLIIHNIARWMP